MPARTTRPGAFRAEDDLSFLFYIPTFTEAMQSLSPKAECLEKTHRCNDFYSNGGMSGTVV